MSQVHTPHSGIEGQGEGAQPMNLEDILGGPMGSPAGTPAPPAPPPPQPQGQSMDDMTKVAQIFKLFSETFKDTEKLKGSENYKMWKLRYEYESLLDYHDWLIRLYLRTALQSCFGNGHDEHGIPCVEDDDA